MNEVTIGQYDEETSNSASTVHISLFPSDLVSYWSRCGLTADFGASFIAFCFPASKSAQNSMSFILNEVVENAVKFSHGTDLNISINLYHRPDTVVFEVENTVDRKQFDLFCRQAAEIMDSTTSLEERFMSALEAKALNAGGSGLGLLTILHDFNTKLGVRMTPAEDADRFRVYVQVIVDPEEI